VKYRRQNTRWGTGSYASWNSNVNQLYTFYDNRNTNQRNHIKTYFGLAGQVDVTLEVNPPGAGYVKISTIVPENLPWTGVYFNGVPVTVTAIPNPGFEFVNWSDNPFIDVPEAISFTNNFTTATTFTANLQALQFRIRLLYLKLIIILKLHLMVGTGLNYIILQT
jgi:hypothetical protein